MEEEGTPGPSCDSNRQILIGISLVRNDQADLGDDIIVATTFLVFLIVGAVACSR